MLGLLAWFAPLVLFSSTGDAGYGAEGGADCGFVGGEELDFVGLRGMGIFSMVCKLPWKEDSRI